MLTVTVGQPIPWDWLATNIKRAQDYLVENTTLGIPAFVQTECAYFLSVFGCELTVIQSDSRFSDWQRDYLQLADWLWMLLQQRCEAYLRQNFSVVC